MRHNRAVAIWLLVSAAMVYVMVVLGGVTRLTESGLSMVDWRPIMGVLPPLDDAEWQATFERYKQSPEYRIVNLDMTVEEFRGIFWMEYIHRLWGRLIGVVFLLPLVYFAMRGMIERRLLPRLAGLFVLGGLQGLMGWYMVKSGLVNDPAVSQYRLTAHLGLAFVIYAALVWVALGLLRPRARAAPDGGGAGGGAWSRGGIRVAAGGLLAFVFLVAMSGGFVAGLDAGLAYNTFPLMDGRLVPPGAFDLSPLYVNFFENTATVQLTHRVLAITLFLAILLFWWRAGRTAPSRPIRVASHLLLAFAVVQVSLGISTLLLFVPVALAAAHQAGALAVFTIVLWLNHALRADASTAPRGAGSMATA